MKSLVERLREGVADTGVLINSAANVNATMYQAADEIEVLRKRTEASDENFRQQHRINVELVEEIERLQKERDNWVDVSTRAEEKLTTAQQAEREMSVHCVTLKKDLDTWRQKAIELGLELSAMSVPKPSTNWSDWARQELMLHDLSRNTCQLEPVSNSYKSGKCVKCENPAQDPTKEHFVVATASEGVSPPEDSTPQRVKAPQTDMVDRIADVLVEDHIALMNELATVTRERDRLEASQRSAWNAAVIKDEQLAACQKDAERWQYWRKQWVKQQFGGEQMANAKELDAAIDAAMKEQTT